MLQDLIRDANTEKFITDNRDKLPGIRISVCKNMLDVFLGNNAEQILELLNAVDEILILPDIERSDMTILANIRQKLEEKYK